jgi:hypothetical protein
LHTNMARFPWFWKTLESVLQASGDVAENCVKEGHSVFLPSVIVLNSMKFKTNTSDISFNQFLILVVISNFVTFDLRYDLQSISTLKLKLSLNNW